MSIYIYMLYTYTSTGWGSRQGVFGGLRAQCPESTELQRVFDMVQRDMVQVLLVLSAGPTGAVSRISYSCAHGDREIFDGDREMVDGDREIIEARRRIRLRQTRCSRCSRRCSRSRCSTRGAAIMGRLRLMSAPGGKAQVEG